MSGGLRLAQGTANASKWLPGLDSNQERQDQNLLCYQLHHRVAVKREDRLRRAASD